MDNQKDLNRNEPRKENDLPEKPKNRFLEYVDSINPRSALIMLVAGAYVAYLGVGLCRGFIAGEEGSNAGFFTVGVVFILLGAFFVFAGGRAALKAQKAKEMAAAEEAAKKEASAEAEASDKDALEETASEEAVPDDNAADDNAVDDTASGVEKEEDA